MALNLGELTVALEVENNLGRGLGEAKRELSTLPPHAQREMTKLSRVMDEEGKKSGGVLAQGVRGGLIRNSPLIVAGVTAALAAGAPAVLAAGTAMFAGLGIAAAVQSNEVRSAWVGLGGILKDEADDIAGPMTDVLVTAATKTAAAYQDMKPQLIDAIAAVAPQVDTLVDSTLGLVQNALPGLTRAAENAGPAIDGLGRFLETTGTATGDFFSSISDHAPAAGEAMDGLGQIVATVLPTLADLLGDGAELASVVLPALVGPLGAVGGALDVATDAAVALEPILPALIAGFIGLKTASAVGGMLDNAAGGMERFGARAGISTTGVGRFRSGLAGATAALPILGAALGVAIDAFGENERNVKQNTETMAAWVRGLNQGGAAAAESTAQMGQTTAAFAQMFGVTEEAIQQTDQWQAALAKGTEQEERRRAALTDSQRASEDLAAAQYNLEIALANSDPTDDAAALAAYEGAQRGVANAAGVTELALHGVTQAMLDQANQALAAIDSGFGYQNSLNQLEDAQAAVAEAQAHLNDENAATRTSTEDVSRAQLALSEQSYRTALAFGQQRADMSGAATDSAEYARIVQEGALQELYRLRDAAGPELAGALNQQIAMLEASGVSLQGSGVQAGVTADRMRGLGLSVREIPGYKGVEIDAPTAEQQQRLRDLGYQVITLPNGRVYVTADTGDAAARVAAIQRQIDSLRGRTVMINVRATMPDLNGAVSGSGRMGTVATGGKVGDAVRGFSGGGKLNGPGTPTSDSIPALTYSGSPLRVSDEEWVIQARAARKYGDARMAAINAGTAVVSAPGRGLAAGGSTGASQGSAVSQSAVFHLYDADGVLMGTMRGQAESAAAGALDIMYNRGGYNG